LVDILEGCRHHAFPVVEPDTRRFVGTVERNTLLHLLMLGKHHGAFVSDSSPSMGSKTTVPYGEMIRHGFPQSPALTWVKKALTPEDHNLFVSLLPYTNQGSYTVQEHTAAMRCYLLFRSMGLRHLPVLGQDHTVCGMLTRKDLLAAAEHHELVTCKSAQQCSEASGKAPSPQDDDTNASMGCDSKV